MEAASGKEIPLVYGPRRAGDLAVVYANPTKAQRELGWKATLGVEEMARDNRPDLAETGQRLFANPAAELSAPPPSAQIGPLLCAMVLQIAPGIGAPPPSAQHGPFSLTTVV